MKTVTETDLKNLRRLTGANFLMTDVGAAAEATIADANKALVLSIWRKSARELLDGVGWTQSKIAMNTFKNNCYV